jgi:hypothetical protein
MYAVDNSVAFDQIRIIVAGVPAASFIRGARPRTTPRGCGKCR